MKISFIICYSSTWPMTIFDKECWPKIDVNLDKKILSNTNLLIKQILNFNSIDKEVILIDNSNDFKTDIIDKNLKVIEGVGDLILNPIKESQINQASVTAMAYDIGIENATGDYLIIQHNDTEYLEQFSDFKTFFGDITNFLEKQSLQYITIDAKPSKYNTPGINYYADCYWFLCRRNFYQKHNIKVGWLKGDNNHDATIECMKKNLRFLHLPGYYELGLAKEFKRTLIKNYPALKNDSRNIHCFNGVPFIAHYKGGTGLKKLQSL